MRKQNRESKQKEKKSSKQKEKEKIMGKKMAKSIRTVEQKQKQIFWGIIKKLQ